MTLHCLYVLLIKIIGSIARCIRDALKKNNYGFSEHGPICGRGGSRFSLKKIFFYREHNLNGRGVTNQIPYKNAKDF